MSRGLAIVMVIVFFGLGAIGCGNPLTEEEKGPSYSDEHIMLVGDWEERIIDDSTVNWSFTFDDMTWGNFTHHYSLENQKILVSGMEYLLVKQSNDTTKIMTPDQKIIQLIRIGGNKKLPRTE